MFQAPHRDPRITWLVIILAVALVMGLGLAFFGVGAELSEERTVVITVRVTGLSHDVSSQITAGEDVFADPGGMRIGVITDADVGPLHRAAADSKGDLIEAVDPTQDQAIITIEATGREGDGIVAIDNQVVQGGQSFNVVTKKLFLRGTVLAVEVY